MAWQIDNAHSAVQFTVRHMMISNVRGMFDKFEGTVDLDENNPENTTVHVVIDTASINTRQEQRDNHLRSGDFFDAENYPQMVFESTRVERTGEDTAKLHGNLTIRNITKPVVLDVEYVGQAKSPWGTTSAGFNASAKINRKDWDLTWNQGLETGGVLVGDDIKINIELELVKQESAQAASAGA
ncbi:MAG TPA: YceI family protein [Aggregatilinea sp.]|uniref:YceI family protein n=1 Tax=Aggregatilinea sp. TaxID=2806333 RepID=UPI002B8B833D|nr:YceI family protein [Aggregatilinea sp.]HML21922.1 YceI family protein [Aggregatilinea sp.]